MTLGLSLSDTHGEFGKTDTNSVIIWFAYQDDHETAR